MSAEDPGSRLRLCGCTVDLRWGVVTSADRSPARLTDREAAVLRFLAARPGETVTRETLLASVWGHHPQTLSRACDNTIRRLRVKIEVDPASPDHVLTVRGEGYRFVPAAAAPGPAPRPVEPRGVLLALGHRTVDLSRQRVRSPDGRAVALTAQEVAILERLAEADGAVVSRVALAQRVWGRDPGAAIDHALWRLRAKIEDDPSHPEALITVRGSGYQLRLPRRPAVADCGLDFVGRETEAAALVEALRPGAWVLVVGPGGVGKSRLVRRVLAGADRAAWWVEAQVATTRHELCAAVAEAFGWGLGDGDPVERVAEGLLREGDGLLALDNLEQLEPDAASAIAEWRRAAPAMGMIGTSRVRLGLPDEHVLELPPLDLRDAEALYADRVHRAGVAMLRADQWQHARALVSRLDRLPLAIELAAARARVLTPGQLLERLDQRLEVLVRAGDDRHRSLQAVFEASLGLLAADEASALLLLGQFQRAFDLDDVEGLLGSGGLSILATLRDHSLLAAEGERFTILESLRVHLAALRRAAGERAMQVRWASWLARRGDPAAVSRLNAAGTRGEWAAMRARLGDFLAGARAALAAGEADIAARCVDAAVAACKLQRPPEGLRELADAVLRQPLSEGSAAALRCSVAYLLQHLDRAAEGYDIALEGAAAAREAGDALTEGACLGAAAFARLRRGQSADELLNRAADAYARADDGARAALHRGLARGRAPEAAAAFEQAVRIARARGHTTTLAHALRELGNHEIARGRVRRGMAHLHEAARRLEELDHVANVYAVWAALQEACLWIGDLEGLDGATERALRAARRRGSRADEAASLALACGAAVVRGALDEAASAMEAARTALQPRVDEEPAHLAMLDWYDAERRIAEGDDQVALACCDRALAFLEPLGIPEGGAVRTSRARAAVGRDPERALRDAREGAQRAGGSERPGYRAFAWARLGDVALRAGDRASAREALVRAEQAAEQGGIRSATGWAGRLVASLAAGVDAVRPPEL